jgi:hypothetical protein
MRKAIGMIVIGASLWFGVCNASADQLDQASAAKFVRDATTYATAAVHNQSAEHSAMNAYVASIRASCPGSLPSSLRLGSRAQQKTYMALVSEAEGGLALAEVSPLRGSTKRFTSEVARLRWSDRSLARAIAALDRATEVGLKLRQPRVCADVQAAAATGFTHRPHDTVAFLKAINASDGDPSLAALVKRMKPDLGDDQKAVARLRNLNRRLERGLAKIVSSPFDKLLDTLVSGHTP